MGTLITITWDADNDTYVVDWLDGKAYTLSVTELERLGEQVEAQLKINRE